MDLVIGTSNDNIGRYLAGFHEHNSDTKIHGDYSAIGWFQGDKIKGTAIFVDYTESNIEIHLHLEHMTRQMIINVYNYVFNQLKCNRLTAKPRSSNERLLQLLPRLGFVYEYTQEDYYGPLSKPEDAEVYKLTRSVALKWIANAKHSVTTTST